MTSETPNVQIETAAMGDATEPAIEVHAHLPRLSPRRRVFKGALISYEGLNTAIPCSVRDMSEGGAQLRLDGAMIAPNHFSLIIDLDGTETDCEVVWRKARDLGVQFRSAHRTVARRRMQVVDNLANAEKSKLKPQLRKRPSDDNRW